MFVLMGSMLLLQSDSNESSEFDLESNYIIESSEAISQMFNILTFCSEQVQAEVLSIFIAICKKCDRTLLRCRDIKLGEQILGQISKSVGVIADLYLDLITILFQLSISLNEFKLLYSQLCRDPITNRLPRHSSKLLQVLTSAIIRDNGAPDAYFSFSGKGQSAISLPPIKNFPLTTGWSFSCWFRYEQGATDPSGDNDSDLTKPYLFCFRTSDGVGYSAHFVSSCIVITCLKTPGKGFQHCVKFEFKPQQWYHLCLSFVHHRWKTSEISAIVNGKEVNRGELSWEVSTNDVYDKCFLGSADTGDESRLFSGQIASVYMFDLPILPEQSKCIYNLGPSYRNQFHFSSESDNVLTPNEKKLIYDAKLSNNIIVSYNPKSTDGNLCLECSPKSRINNNPNIQSIFVHTPHALMLSEVEAVFTNSVENALHSVGGIEVLFPLFSQLDVKEDLYDTSMTKDKVPPKIATNLLRLIERLLKSSINAQQQMVQSKGFLLAAHWINQSSAEHITIDFLKVILDILQMLEAQPYGIILTKQICDYILFNPALWIYADPTVQLTLYTFFAKEFVKHTVLKTTSRRVSTVLIFLHALKYYYWLDDPTACSGFEAKGLSALNKKRPHRDEIRKIRTQILLFIKALMCVPLTGETNSLYQNRRTPTGEEIQAMLNYLLVLQEPENILDDSQLLLAITAEQPVEIVALLDNHGIIPLIFKLLACPNEQVRVHGLKIFAFWLAEVSQNRIDEVVASQSLWDMVYDRISLHKQGTSISTYNSLIELLFGGRPSPHTSERYEPVANRKSITIQHPAILKIITLTVSENENTDLRMFFLRDLYSGLENSEDNCRILLQQTVWQDWLLLTTPLKPQTDQEFEYRKILLQILKVLLFHAVKKEYGGWRVFVDTIAIIHAKTSYEEHRQYLTKMYEQYQESATVTRVDSRLKI